MSVSSSALRVARRFQASLADQLETRINQLLADLDPGRGRELGQWLEDNFFFLGAKTPKGQKALKENVRKLHWFVKHGLAQSQTPERLRDTIEGVWGEIKPHLADLTRYFSTEGGKNVPKEITLGGNTYVNVSGFDEELLGKYAKRIETVFDSLKGWRRKALAGGVRVALAGPRDFRGTSKGTYRSSEDTLYVRATPEVLKRSGDSYASVEYIIVHELGHRYERKRSVGIDFDKPEWWSSQYSRKEGEAFAELFALTNFDITGYGSEAVLKRFESVMAGREDPIRPGLPEHLKRYFTQ